MTERLLRLIREDHRRLTAQVEELRKTCGRDGISEGECFRKFRQAKAFFSAQAKAKEYTLYAYLEEGPARDHSEILGLIYQVYEEHDLADLVLKEMGQAEELSLAWNSRLQIFFEMLKHHLKKEEAELLPRALPLLSDEVKETLCADYEREREQLYAKKSGQSSPAPLSYSTSHRF